MGEPRAAAEAVVLPPPPRVGESERLGATMVLSVLVHAMLILGIGFAVEDAAPMMPTLDVILSQTRTGCVSAFPFTSTTAPAIPLPRAPSRASFLRD